jgi:hypothetical protein
MRVERGELRVADAAALLGLQRRQIFRLLERLRSDGASGLISRKRGRASNWRYSDAFRDRVITIIREHYSDFGPTLAKEYHRPSLYRPMRIGQLLEDPSLPPPAGLMGMNSW